MLMFAALQTYSISFSELFTFPKSDTTEKYFLTRYTWGLSQTTLVILWSYRILLMMTIPVKGTETLIFLCQKVIPCSFQVVFHLKSYIEQSKKQLRKAVLTFPLWHKGIQKQWTWNKRMRESTWWECQKNVDKWNAWLKGYFKGIWVHGCSYESSPTSWCWVQFSFSQLQNKITKL